MCSSEENINELMSLYRKNYNNLLSTSKMIRSSEFDLDEDVYDQMNSESEESEGESDAEENSNVKRVKLNPE